MLSRSCHVISNLLIMIHQNNALQKCPQPIPQNLKICHITWQTGIKVADRNKSDDVKIRRLSWIIWLAPVKSWGSWQEKEEQKIREAKCDRTRPAIVGFENGGRKTWPKERRWPLETAKGKKTDSPLEFLERNAALLTFETLIGLLATRTIR